MHGNTGGHMGGGHVPPPVHHPPGHFDQAVHSDHAYIAGLATDPRRNKVARWQRHPGLTGAILLGFLVALVLLVFLA